MTNTYSPNNTVLKLKEKNDKIEKRNISKLENVCPLPVMDRMSRQGIQ